MNNRRPFKISLKCFVALLFIVSAQVQAQQNKEADSLLKKAVMEVYNDPAKSIAIANQVFKASGSDSQLKIRSLMAMAQANVMLTKYENVLENAAQALRIAEDVNDYNNQIVINNFLGNHYFRLELKDKAWASLKIAEELVAKHPPADSLSHIKGNVYLLKGYLYADKLDCNYASIYFDKAITCFEKSPNKDFSKINLGVVYTQKGRCLLDGGQLAEAEGCFRKAVAISSENNNIGVNVFSRMSLAQVYAKQKHFTKSNDLLLKTLGLAKEAKQMELEKEIYKQLSENYLALNDIKKHAHYNELYNLSLKRFVQSETKSVDKIANTVSSKNNAEKAASNVRSNWAFWFFAVLLTIIFLLFLSVFTLKRRIRDKEGNPEKKFFN